MLLHSVNCALKPCWLGCAKELSGARKSSLHSVNMGLKERSRCQMIVHKQIFNLAHKIICPGKGLRPMILGFFLITLGFFLTSCIFFLTYGKKKLLMTINSVLISRA